MSAGWSTGSTRAWRKLRRYVLDRDGHRCLVPVAGGVCGAKATTVGHLDPLHAGGPKLAPADAVVDEMMDRIFAETDYKSGDNVAVLVNGLGGTPLEELYILFRRVSQLLEARGVAARHVWVGEFATSMEMAGASISILHLDDELDRLMAAPANTPFFQHVAG